MNRSAIRLSIATAFLLLGGCMSYPSDPAGSNIDLRATLNGANEVPADPSIAGGYLKAQYSTQTRILKWQLVVNGLSGPMTRGFFHGPDSEGNEAALVPINPPFSGNTQIGGATLTQQQAADLLAGRWYVDLQTEKYPSGEIRGTVARISR